MILHFQEKHGEVNDIIISSCAPYFNAVMLEKRQAEIVNKAKKKIKQMENIEIFKMKDIL